MATIAINLSKSLRDKLGEEGGEDFVNILNQINTAQLEEMERLNGQTFEKFRTEIDKNREILEIEIKSVRTELEGKIESIKNELEGKIESIKIELRGEIEGKLAGLKADIIKWMFIFWASAILTIVAGYFFK